VVVADEVGPAELDEPRDGLADDDRAEMPDVHLLGGVGGRVVDDDLAAAHQAGRAGAPLGFVAVLAQPAAEGDRRELEVQEARAGHLDLHQRRVEPALRLQRLEQRGREGAGVRLGLLGRGEHAVGLEVRMAGVRRLELGIEVALEAGDGRGGLAKQGRGQD